MKKEIQKKIPFTTVIAVVALIALFIAAVYLQKKNENNSTDNALEEQSDSIETLNDTEIADLSSEYSFSDYDSIQTENADITTYDSAMKYPVIINESDGSVYLSALNANDASMAEDDLLTILYQANGESRKSSDELSSALTEEQNEKYPVVSETKYYKFVQIADNQYCDTFSGVIYEKDSGTGTIMPIFTTDGSLYTLDEFESGE